MTQKSYAYTTDNPFVIEKINQTQYAVMGNEDSRQKFSKESLEVPVEAPRSMRLLKLFSDDDRIDIEKVITEYNNYYLSSRLSGVYTVCPRKYFVSDAIFQEANAATIYQMYNIPNLGVGVQDVNLNLKISNIDIDGDYAKVAVDRRIDLVFEGDNEKSTCGGPEAYLMKKTNGHWQIENIIFATDFVTDTYNAFLQSREADVWMKKYTFEACPRKSYESDHNFADYLVKDATYPNIRFEMLNFPDDYAESAVAVCNEIFAEQYAAVYYSKSKCADYAQRYGADPNLQDYIYFGGLQGGDCTNFVSQCIHAGGLPMSSGWYHRSHSSYSTSWIRVIELRDYLINNNLAQGYYQQIPNYPSGVGVRGTPIQFSNGNQWIHSAIIMGKDGGRGYYTAEHSGLEGNTTKRYIGNNLTNRRTFWVGAG